MRLPDKNLGSAHMALVLVLALHKKLLAGLDQVV